MATCAVDLIKLKCDQFILFLSKLGRSHLSLATNTKPDKGGSLFFDNIWNITITLKLNMLYLAKS
jgi:hypothetical protein